jgi:hypothetical protein
MTKLLHAVCVAMVLIASQVYAIETPSGKPAGIKKIAVKEFDCEDQAVGRCLLNGR